MEYDDVSSFMNISPDRINRYYTRAAAQEWNRPSRADQAYRGALNHFLEMDDIGDAEHIDAIYNEGYPPSFGSSLTRTYFHLM